MGHQGLLVFLMVTLYILGKTCLKSTIESKGSEACTQPSFLSKSTKPRKQKNVFTALRLPCFPGLFHLKIVRAGERGVRSEVQLDSRVTLCLLGVGVPGLV